MSEPEPPAKPVSIEAINAQLDFAKLIITLSSGAIAFSITFLEKFVPRVKDAAIEASGALITCWILFALAIAGALLTIMALTGTLEAIDRRANSWRLTPPQEKAAGGDDSHVRWSAILMVFSFLFGVGAMIVVGVQR